jgi:uncharacterized protein YbjQ (UPF0145 family)
MGPFTDLLLVAFQLLIVLLPIALGFAIGTWREWRHLKSLDQRERALAGTCVILNTREVPDPSTVRHCALVTGDAVIASDLFKSFAAGLRNIVGGEVRTLETLMDRARREAILRMLDDARSMGAAEVYNVRLQSSNIRGAGLRRKAGVSVELFAFGTAVVRG